MVGLQWYTLTAQLSFSLLLSFIHMFKGAEKAPGSVLGTRNIFISKQNSKLPFFFFLGALVQCERQRKKIKHKKQ